MNFNGWIPPEIAIMFGLILLFGGAWVVYFLYLITTHVSFGWH
jgi:hypothetical protein